MGSLLTFTTTDIPSTINTHNIELQMVKVIAEKNIDLVVPGFEPRTSRKPGECSTIELHMIAVFLLCNSL